MTKLKKIAQIGSFDVENFGDLLFPDVLKAYFKNSKIDLFSPVGGNKCFDDWIVYPVSDFESKCISEKYDAVIIGGGDLVRTDKKVFITNEYYEYSSEPSLQLWAYPIMVAKKYNIPIIFNAPGVTNSFFQEEEFLVRKILSYVDYVTVRDTESQKILETIGVSSEVVPDTVFSISNIVSCNDLKKVMADLKKDKIVPDINDYIVFQHNSTNVDDLHYYSKIKEFIRHVAQDKKVLFMPIGYIHNDHEILSDLYKENIDNTYIVNLEHKLTPNEMLAILSNSSGYIGTSMHGSIVSHSYGKPVFILNSMNSRKLHGFANVSNNVFVDVNNVDNLIYCFDKYFNKNKKNNIKQLIEKIDDHFKRMEIVKSNVSINFVDYTDYIRDFYNSDNSNTLYGMYYKNDDYLNRINFIYKNNANVYEYEIKSVKNSMVLVPVINRIFIADKIYINDQLVYFNVILTNRFKIDIDSNIKIKIVGRVASEDDIIDLINNSSYEDSMIYEYKILEEKYCDLLK